ncbi:MAG: ParB N-terminal domain-containing protein [Clostridiales Family XIII bacterium]|jgi:guanylate kinase|nr:ParB N-terminal domain-containing protein [Clostridiales Family XIII bacterium]
MLVILSGSSGVGKNTVINEMLRRYDDYELLPTYTTRARRENETQGNPYFFISDHEFKNMLEQDAFFEHQIVHEHYYGIAKQVLFDRLKSSKILIKDIDVLGTINLLNEVKNEFDILTFFYYVKSKDILVERLKGRNEANIKLRLQRYEMEKKLSPQYDYVIENNDMEKTLLMTKQAIDYEISNEYLLPTKHADMIDKKRIKKLAKEIKSGHFLPGIDVSFENGNLYIIDGHHRYLASVLAKGRIAKHIIDAKHIEKADHSSWESLCHHFGNGKHGI